jgi:hypothetical protein
VTRLAMRGWEVGRRSGGWRDPAPRSGEWEERAGAPVEPRFHFPHGYDERGAVGGCVREREVWSAAMPVPKTAPAS